MKLNENPSLTYNSAAARPLFGEILERVASGERVTLMKYNKPIAVVISVKEAQKLKHQKGK